MVERGGLENRYVRKGIGGSNPSPSAKQSGRTLTWSVASPGGPVNSAYWPFLATKQNQRHLGQQ